jgi:transcriptional regulator with XRE-family HTH domain
MTQVKGAQEDSREVALRMRATPHSLAQRRASFEAQMRDMALSDLNALSDRLKALHKRLEQVDGRKWTQYQLADKMDIPPRTFQSWENGEVENRGGEGYEKIARFYRRKLGDKTITRQWIVFGDQAQAPAPDPFSPPAEVTDAAEIRRLLVEIRDMQDELVLAVAAVRDEQSRLRQLRELDERIEGVTGG